MIDDFVAALSEPWPRDSASSIIGMLRRPGLVDESIKWGNPFFSVQGHAVAKIFVAEDWITVYFYRGLYLADPDSLLGAEGSSAMKKLRIERGEAVPEGIRGLMDDAVGLATRE